MMLKMIFRNITISALLLVKKTFYRIFTINSLMTDKIPK